MFLSGKAAAAYLNVSFPTLKRLVSEGRIKAVRPSGKILKFEQLWLDEYLSSVTINKNLEEVKNG